MSKTPYRSRQRSPLTVAQILTWADAFFARMGRWPRRTDGTVAGARHTTWLAVNAALIHGFRGLPGGTSLAQLLAERRGHRNIKRLPSLAEAEILAWADAHRRRTGRWPTVTDGAVP